jgi:hypothetical protein
MKIYSLPILALACLQLCLPRASAQSSTNAVLTATLNLTAYIQQPTNDSGLRSVSIKKFATKDIIASIEADLGLPTNDAPTAKLLMKFAGLGGAEAPELDLFLRNSGGDTRLTNSIFNVASGSTSIGNLTVSTVRSVANRVSTRLDYTLVSISLNTTNMSFQAQGQVKIQQSSVKVGSTIIESRPIPTAYSSSLTGSGTVGTNSAVFSGTFTAGNRKVETQ